MQHAHISGIAIELLTPKEMAQVDRLAVELGTYDGYALMKNAGSAVFSEVLRRYPAAIGFDVLCGPGNNGGDGYVVARLLHEAGCRVRLWADGIPKRGSDAARAVIDCPLAARPLEEFLPIAGYLIVDALYGAGLGRSLYGAAKDAVLACREAGSTVVAVDLPSGLSGETGYAKGASFVADLTVTFFRLKPGHLLEPGRRDCGEIVLADIGIASEVLKAIGPTTFINMPFLWRDALPSSSTAQHKYSRGYAAVLSGEITGAGAARLAAMGAARAGAGAVAVYSPASALTANAAQLTSIMLRKVDDKGDLLRVLAERLPDSFVLGPGFGLHRPVREMVLAVLEAGSHGVLVLDADGITAFRNDPQTLFEAARHSDMSLILTPHEGEFARIFPDISTDETLSKPGKARAAAIRAQAVVVYKGPDTVIAAPDGRAAINANGSPWLATAGSGDVLSGLIAGLTSQKMPPFEAACAAAWFHAEAATRFGVGLIAEDLPGLLPPLLRDILETKL